MKIEKMKVLFLSIAVCLLGAVGTVSAQEETAAPDAAQIEKWVEEMQSPDGGELAKIIWDIVDKIMAEVKNETL